MLRSGAKNRRSLVACSWPTWIVAGALILPLIAAAVWLSRSNWPPLYDMAMFEMHVRDVGTSHTPLVGLSGRFGRFSEPGFHPGPLAFYMLAPVYRLLGSSYWALRVSACVLTSAAMVSSVLMARRRAGAAGVLAIGAVLAMLELGFGLLTLTEPWNAYVPVMWFVAFLISFWSIADGDDALLPVNAAIGSLCAQTHVSFLPVCGGLSVIAFVVVTNRLARTWREQGPARRLLVVCAVTLGVVSALWSPVVLQQWTRERGNLTIQAIRVPGLSGIDVLKAERIARIGMPGAIFLLPGH